jgi:hypothetical protein
VSRPARAFVNLAYGQPNESLYLSLIAGLAGFGLVPRAALFDPSARPQLARIQKLIGDCDYSFHDLSWMKLDGPPPKTPRLNMAFELGLAFGVSRWHRPKHQIFILDKVPHRVAKALSDLQGTNVFIHDGGSQTVLREISNALVRVRSTPTLRDLLEIYDGLLIVAKRLKAEDGFTTLFAQRPFRELGTVALRVARELRKVHRNSKRPAKRPREGNQRKRRR